MLNPNPASARHAIFLEEMGVGPSWRLRRTPTPDTSLTAQLEPMLPTLVPGSDVSEPAIAAMDWRELKAAAATCTRCDLCRSRKGVVFGRGDPNADWLIVGNGPGRADEQDGRAVTGSAGTLLDNMLLAIGLQPEENVYVTSMVKCRVPDADAGAAPTQQQIAACQPYLERELALTRARIIVAIGQAAATGLLGLPGLPSAARGVVHRFGAIPVVLTEHPEDLLHQGINKAATWADLCLARAQAASDA